jgi:hypothetical protein
MKLALLFTFVPLALGWPPTTAPPIFSVTCVLGNTCPPGSICTQTETCRGQCAATPTSLSLAPCTVGQSGACSTGSTCTPTMSCATGTPCGGLCLPTLPPVIPCTVGNNGACPAGSTCTPTMGCPPTASACGGQCIATPTSSPVVPCIVGANDCPSQSLCSQTMTCGGLCIPTPTLTASPTSTASACGGHHKPHCPDDFKCVRHSAKNCGPDSQCLGVCVRKNKDGDCDDDGGNRKGKA